MSGSRNRKKRPPARGAGGRMLLLLLILVGSAWGLSKALENRAPAPSPVPTMAATPIPVATARPTITPVPTPPKPDVDVNSWQLRLIRYENPLGETFVPESLTNVENDQKMDSRVAPALSRLLDDARAAGYSVYLCSGYRDYDTQYTIYWNHIEQYMAQGMTEEEAHAKTREAVNYPGASEHQSGLCADILESYDQEMEPWIGGSGLMLWLEQHCAEYGFVIRYPKDKTDITGIEYEPWHLRYVGQEAAAYMMEKGLCLEEFLELYEVG